MFGMSNIDLDQSSGAEAVIITQYSRSHIRGSDNPDIVVEDSGNEEILVMQEGDAIAMSRAEAEALYLVLSKMLGPRVISTSEKGPSA